MLSLLMALTRPRQQTNAKRASPVGFMEAARTAPPPDSLRSLSARCGPQANRRCSAAYILGRESRLFVSGYYTGRFYLRYQGMLIERSLPCRIQ